MKHDFLRGMDLSTLLEVERCGGKFYDDGVPGDAMDILKRYGMNSVRLRLWNDPFDQDGHSYGAGGDDIETVLTLARRAKEKGLSWLLALHYSDFWADPGKQRLPKAWRGMGMEALPQAVHDYTAQVLRRCQQEGLLPQMVAVGNELSNGLLWPYGKMPNYENIAALVSAGIRAVRETDSCIPVMLHLDNGGNNTLYRTWFDAYRRSSGADFDCIGLSYYPFWHGSLSMLQNNLKDLAERYGKPMIVTEVSMGYTMEDYAAYEGLAPNARKGMATRQDLVEKIDYPMTKQGQADFLRDFLRVLRSVSLVKGFYYWEPAWIPVPGSGWANEAAWEYVEESGPGGNEWANQALFDYDGNALPALKVIREQSKGNV